MTDVKTFYPAAAERSPWARIIITVGVLAALLPLMLYAYYGAVQHNLAFTVNSEELEVKFGLGRFRIPADEIAAVTLVEAPAPMGRTRGAGLTNLQMGWYTLDGYGRVYRLTTARSPLVYVDVAADAQRARAGTRYVFSPEDAEGFASLLGSAAAGRGTSAGGSGPVQAVFPSAAAKSVLGDPLLLFAIFITVPLGIGMPFIVGRGRRGMRYDVGPGGIRIHHLGEKKYRWSSIKDVRRLDEPAPNMVRLIGTGMPGYYTGTFRVSGVGEARVYASRLRAPLVLIELNTSRLLISPDDVDGFMGAVHRFRAGGSGDGGPADDKKHEPANIKERV